MSAPSSENRATGSGGPEEQYSFFADKASRMTEPLRQEARVAAERQKDHGADQLIGLAQAIRRAARELEPQLPQTAACVRGAAGGLERLSASLRRQDIGELAGSFARAAKERPAAVFAGAVFVGFVLSRVLRNTHSGSDR